MNLFDKQKTSMNLAFEFHAILSGKLILKLQRIDLFNSHDV